ncbi:endogenous retrovirus group K member 10 Gag polyprotein-like [Nannospalax galili]|uniref:endogenous retrovirus group K member 10 Gag polyprotein-like n=1 Tax=Nannospalax galili TaxID=1026970 RepID=UPI00111BD162|nr:endogenous retrovirus group K member 10 Gag polyprotein-like [Nannospalax galili]
MVMMYEFVMCSPRCDRSVDNHLLQVNIFFHKGVSMGQGNSRLLFVHMLKNILKVNQMHDKEKKLLFKDSSTPSNIAGLDSPEIGDNSVIAMVNNSSTPSCPLSLMSPLQRIVQQAAAKGDDISEFNLFPVMEQDDGQGNRIRTHIPFPFKQLKELKSACSQYGPTAPFTQAVLESLTTEVLAPNNWKQIARACLSGGHYLLWKSEFGELCQATADINRVQNIAINFDMLAGKGQYRETAQQITFNIAAYAQTSAAAKKAWNKLPSSGQQTENLSKIRQGPDEAYQDFVSRLLQATRKLIGDTDAGLLLVRQLAYENANSVCQAALRPYRKKGNLFDYIRLCSDIGPSYTQGVAIAAALQAKSMKDIIFQQQSKKRCFKCGQQGHSQNSCPRGTSNFRQGKGPPMCPRCKKDALLIFTNGSSNGSASYVANGENVVVHTPHSSVQIAELQAVALVFQKFPDQEFNLFTDSFYVALQRIDCGILLLPQIMQRLNGKILTQDYGMGQIQCSFGGEDMFVFPHRMLKVPVGCQNGWCSLLSFMILCFLVI